MTDFQKLVTAELAKARRKFNNLNSGHEAYAVIKEELDEFWEDVRRWKGGRHAIEARGELVQIAAMAQRAAEDLGFMDIQSELESSND